MSLISIIVPCYNEQESLPLFYDEISKIAEIMYEHEFEFLFIDDGSKDNTINILKSLSISDHRVRYISFSRNFGKEAAIYAGLENAFYSKDGLIAIMDVDLQDPPSLLIEMYEGITHEGFDCVATRRSTRLGEPKLRSFFAQTFYKIINKISKIEIVDGARDYRLMTRQMVDSILEMAEYNRFSKGIFSWVGYKTKWLEYENVERAAGQTKWSFWKLFIYALEGVVAFTTTPLAISSIVGFAFCLVSFIMILVIVTKTLLFGDPVAGYPSLVCIIFFIGGIQLFCMGIVGQYLSKTYMETKRRPIYLVKESTENNKSNHFHV
ncbi:glycosyltransferase [Paenibacillus glucanolyticus]|jgi:glucosyltransferase|nr:MULTISPECIES: glycosyltransferase family 2 protein [Paenibacillus]ANA79727.1 bactoprenol glucosyl transferase [Paenibacillus glucanolyticus]AVV56250.1 glycosyltransferase [Paenibacillus glucanolyticus]ETT34078.1 glycosyl transferase family protein [Paenibacillus sp. FSL R5-808]MPY20128.1 glycosyltransferase family 2 protein [Paenibacillus glucanolyticus]